MGTARYIILLLFHLAALDAKQFRSDYKYDSSTDGWFKLHEIPATWRDARLRCQHEGAVLASPEDKSLLEAMQGLIRQQKLSSGIYTGTHATFSKGDYYSIQGVPLTKFQNIITWAPNEPDNSDNSEECLVMLPNGTMADAPCNDVLPYLCFKKRTKSVINGCGTLDSNYAFDARTGSCYKFHREPQTWSRAFAACAGEGGHLAIVNSDAEAQVLKEIHAKNPSSAMPGTFNRENAFIGLNDWQEHGFLLTIHGQTLEEAGYSKWGPGQPNNLTGGQFCGSIRRDALLDDVSCIDRCPFVCEKSPDSLIPSDDQILYIYD